VVKLSLIKFYQAKPRTAVLWTLLMKLANHIAQQSLKLVDKQVEILA
jgi:hypothetical protein